LVFTAATFLFNADINVKNMLSFWGDPAIVLLISLLFSTYTLGISSGYSLKAIMNYFGDAVKDIAVILLIIAGAGALKQILVDSGINDSIALQLSNLPIHPLVLGWLIAAVIRVCLGSATVAGLTAAGIVAPLVISGTVNPNLMVLSVGAGSLMFSHVNDSGFWMFKEYFNLSIKDTLRSWSVMETIVAVMGLIGVLLLQIFV
jgi:Gnt-I system high-affinity gluconate transporter